MTKREARPLCHGFLRHLAISVAVWGGPWAKSREPQIILKTDQRKVILELGLGENSKRNQAAGTRTGPSSKAMFL